MLLMQTQTDKLFIVNNIFHSVKSYQLIGQNLSYSICVIVSVNSEIIN